MKYKTARDLFAASHKGELEPGFVLVLDNDDCGAYEGDEEVYEGCHPDVLLREALDYLGITWDNA
jgi:hypothetical protein